MNLNSLKIATDGYLKRTTKAVLVIAVAGYLNFGDVPPTPSTNLSDGYYPIYENINDKKQINKLAEQKIHNELILVEILKFWSKEMQ